MIIDKKVLLKTAFALYGVLMLWLLFGQRVEWFEAGNYSEQIKQNISLVPFNTIRIFIRNLSESENPDLIKHAIINLAGNVVMFVPLGFFIPAVSVKLRTFVRTIVVSVLLITAVEISQLFLLLGSCDTDDLILNIIGVSLGCLIFKMIRGRKK